MSTILRAAAIAATLVSSVRASAEDPSESGWDVDLSVPVALITGHTTYRIHASDSTGSITSELEFPLLGPLAGVRGQFSSPRDPSRRRWVLEASGLMSFTGPVGTMKDSDWLSDSIDIATVGATNPGKDIYSESKAELRTLIFEGRVAWQHEPSPGFRVSPLAGVLYQRFKYDVRDVTQVGYGPYAAGFSGSASGRVLAYEVSYRAPYAGVRGELVRGGFSATAELWYSPFASATDRDDHMLRSKLSTTDASGTAWEAGLGAKLALGPSDALQGQLFLVRFNATGTQFQRFYGGPNVGQSGTIGSAITSSRATALVAWTHRM